MQKPRIIRYKRFNKYTQTKDWKRVELMLYFPWRDENYIDQEYYLEDIYLKHIDIIILNKLKYENPQSSNIFSLAETMLQKKEELYMQLNSSDLIEQQQIKDYLMRNDTNKVKNKPKNDNYELAERINDSTKNISNEQCNDTYEDIDEELYEEIFGYQQFDSHENSTGLNVTKNTEFLEKMNSTEIDMPKLWNERQ